MLITSHAVRSVYLNPRGFISRRRRLAKSGEKHLEVFYVLFCFPVCVLHSSGTDLAFKASLASYRFPVGLEGNVSRSLAN